MQKQDVDSAMNCLLTAVDNRIEAALKKINFDKTKKGIIRKVNTNNTYIVQIGQDEYTLPAITWRTFKVDDVCLIVFPQNNIQEAFIV